MQSVDKENTKRDRKQVAAKLFFHCDENKESQIYDMTKDFYGHIN